MKLLSFANAYRQNSVQTVGPGQLILMLFDGALRFMNRALQGFEQDDVFARNEAVHVNLMKTQAIITELQDSLNLEVGGTFARTMSDLYDYMRTQLRHANMRKDAEPMLVVMELITEIRGAWAAMLAQAGSADSETQALVATAA